MKSWKKWLIRKKERKVQKVLQAERVPEMGNKLIITQNGAQLCLGFVCGRRTDGTSSDGRWF